MLLLLAGCGAPISNELLEEEASFLAALPSPERVGAPEPVRLAAEGPDPVLAAGREAAERWYGLVEVPLALSGALRTEPPDERTDVARRWEPLEVALLVDGTALGVEGAATGYAKAEILQLDDGSFQWTVDLASSAEGPWDEVGTGRQQGLLGDESWDLAAVARTIGGTETPGDLVANTVDADPDAGEDRSVDAEVRDGPVAVPYQLVGPAGITFQADLQLTDDGLSWPAAMTVFHDPEQGGVGGGVVFLGTTELAFTECWDAQGVTLSRTGDPGITPVAGPSCGTR